MLEMVLGCVGLLVSIVVFFWWITTLSLLILNPTFLRAPQLFAIDTFCLGAFTICATVWAYPRMSTRALRVFLGIAAVFFALIFVKSAWILAALHAVGIREAAATVAMRRYTVALLVAVPICGFAMFEGGGKTLKRGVEIRPLKMKKGEDGIAVGAFAPDLLPADLAGFVKARAGDGIVLPVELLTRGISILGDPGSGKSRLMRLLHSGIEQRFPDIPVLIHDPKGEWLRTCYDPARDLIFAPCDKRGVAWDILADLKTNPQLMSPIIATAVNQHLGSGGGDNLFWANSAAALIQEQFETSDDFLSFRDSLLRWRESRGDDKTALSTFGSARPAIKDLATIALAEGVGEKRTMEQFLNHRGRIFLLNSPTQSAEQSGAFAIFISAFALSCLSQPDTATPRAIAIIDEALTFHLPPAVEQAVTAQARSKGLVTIAAAQWLPKDERRLLTRAEFLFGMRVGDLETAKKLAALSGHAVYDEEVTTKSSGSGTSTSTSRQERSRQVMPPEYFRSLPERSFVLLHQAGLAPGRTAEVGGVQDDRIATFDYQRQPLLSEYMRVL